MSFAGKKHSPEARAKMSSSHRKHYQEDPEYYLERIQKAQAARAEIYLTQQDLARAGIEWRPYRHSPETRAKISAALKGRKPSDQCMAALAEFREEVREDRQKLQEAQRDNPLFWDK